MQRIIPAILTKDIAELENKLTELQGLVDWVQIDIMDGKFVNNASITLEDVSGLEIIKNFSIEAHLMVENPVDYFLECQKSNVQRVIFHIEAGDTEQALLKAQECNFQKGLALNPETPVEKILPYLSNIDVVLLMSVHPGFGGQAFIEQTLDKIKTLKKLLAENLPLDRQVKIEVDGGINLDNIKKISHAGADYMVMGSSLFENANIKQHFKELNAKI